MLKLLRFIVLYFAAWLLFFAVARLYFHLGNGSKVAEAGLYEVLPSYCYGLRMDASITAYYTAPLLIILILQFLVKSVSFKKLAFGYTILLIIFSVSTVIPDLFLYKSWGNRIDSSFLKYLSNPSELWASVSNQPILLIFIGLLLIVLLLIYFFSRLFVIYPYPISLPKYYAGMLLLLAGVLLIPMRGGLQLAPLNQSSVYYSENHFANLSALNAPWNFVFSALKTSDIPDANSYKYLPDEESQKVVDSLLNRNGFHYRPFLDSSVKKPNIIFITWESLTSKAINLKYNNTTVLPGLDSVILHSVYFDSVYAAGDRTDRGLVALLSSFPPLPTISIIKDPRKSQSLAQYGNLLSKNGYHNYFYYGGETEFANIKSYLLDGSFKQIVSEKDFNKNDLNSKWGAHDGVVAKRLIHDLDTLQQPFFVNWLTLSSHEPFETPEAPVITGSSDEAKFLNSLHYTDEVVTNFLEASKAKPWWNNTLIVISGDHGHPLPDQGSKVKNFRTPVILTGGAVNQVVRLPFIKSQLDIWPEIMLQIGIKNATLGYGKPLSDSVNQWAYLSFTDGFGFLSPNGYAVFDNVGKRNIESRSGSGAARMGKAMQRQVFKDFLSR